MNHTDVTKKVEEQCRLLFGCSLASATPQEAYHAVCSVIRNLLNEKSLAFSGQNHTSGRKQVYYLSMEFLVGTSLRNHLFHLGLERTFEIELAIASFSEALPCSPCAKRSISKPCLLLAPQRRSVFTASVS